MATLIVWESDGRVEKLRVPDEGLTIGRRPTPYGASYCSTSSAVSRLHCRLARLGEGWFVEDLGSANGTLLNGEPAEGPTPIRSGDVLSLGPREHGLTAQLVLPEPLPMGIVGDATMTIDDEPTALAEWGAIDKVRTSYDVVADKYAAELADDMVARPIERGLFLAFSEMVRGVGPGIVGDVGCGPGQVMNHLANLGLSLVGIDISPQMIEQARRRFPAGDYRVGSMLELPFERGAWIGAVSMWATLHASPADRARAFAELHRVVRPGGWVLHSFYVSAPDQPSGSVYRLEKWFGRDVALDTYFISIDDAAAELDGLGFDVMAALAREPLSNAELPARRCYMMLRRR